VARKNIVSTIEVIIP